MAETPVTILGFAGSLRRASFNRALLRAAAEAAPATMQIKTFDLAPVPLYNADLEAEGDHEERGRLGVASAEGRLVDDATRERLAAWLVTFEAWVRRLS